MSFQGDITRKLIVMIELYGLSFWVVVEYAFHSMAPSGAGAEAPTPLGFGYATALIPATTPWAASLLT